MTNIQEDHFNFHRTLLSYDPFTLKAYSHHISAGIGIGNGWMSPLDQGKYASFLYYHGLLDHHQYQELDIIDSKILKMIEKGRWLGAWKASDEQLNYILTALNYSNLYDMSKESE